MHAKTSSATYTLSLFQLCWAAGKVVDTTSIGARSRCLSPHGYTKNTLRHSWEGLIVGTDGGVNWKNECMGARYAAGAGQVPDDEQAV